MGPLEADIFRSISCCGGLSGIPSPAGLTGAVQVELEPQKSHLWPCASYTDVVMRTAWTWPFEKYKTHMRQLVESGVCQGAISSGQRGEKRALRGLGALPPRVFASAPYLPRNQCSLLVTVPVVTLYKKLCHPAPEESSM